MFPGGMTSMCMVRRWLLGNRWPVERATERDEDLVDEIIVRFHGTALNPLPLISES